MQVHENFKFILVCSQADAASLDRPLLNRFEKHVFDEIDFISKNDKAFKCFKKLHQFYQDIYNKNCFDYSRQALQKADNNRILKKDILEDKD